MDASVIKGVEGLELNGSDAAIRKSSISRIAVEGYDTTSHPRVDVEEALRKHFASRGIKLIHASAPEIDIDFTILCRYALIYVNEEDEAEALKLDGSDMGGRILRVTAYPFGNNRLEHLLSPTKAQDDYLQRTLDVTGFDTSMAKDDVKEMVRRVFPRTGSGCSVFGDGRVFVYLRGRDAIDKALKLSGGSVGGFKIVVNEVLPIQKLGGGGGVSRASMLAMAERDKAARLAMAEKDKAMPCEGNQKAIMTTD
ncbi:RNA-binding (RRM/RBD/RNP motifs) family protein [Raphanus sativus]|uniref:Nucleolin 1-like n=1 Tax=Raphanus sativus TaxID=3726 RepID=A0A6J0LFE2_RAPSA|nr:nucleolin 1-like [Raphanus sativus]KAJ4896847.1 RNA-binding (RRM/RBD/RNP motifs) family protein [Raphanus sativus]